MPLYLVRWPTFEVSLIRAKDKRDLLETIDEIADPSGCTWKVYNGPLHLDFNLGIKVEDKSDYKAVPFKPRVKINAASELHEGYKYAFEENHSDTIGNMWDEITKTAFPHLWAHYEPCFTTKPEKRDEEALKKEFEKAVIADMRGLFELEFTTRFPGRVFDQN